REHTVPSRLKDARRKEQTTTGTVMTESNKTVTKPYLPVRWSPIIQPLTGEITKTNHIRKNSQNQSQGKQSLTMKIRHACVLIIVVLLSSDSARAANWEVVASPSGGRQANSLSSVAAVADNDVWAVGWAFNQSLFAYRTLTEHWNGTRWSVVRSPNATSGYNL